MGTNGKQIDQKLVQKLIKLKKEIQDAKSRRSEIQGELKSIKKQLEQDFNVSGLEEARELLESLQETLNDHEEILSEKLKQAQELFEGKES